jgi:nucleoside 2-deoxyribosyltransferase
VKLKYLATPYTLYPGGIEEAFRAAARIAAQMIRDGDWVFSPICHSHPIATIGNLDALSHELWMQQDQAMMDRADELVVAMLPGWDESRGIAHEIAYFEAQGKPVTYIDPAPRRA